MEIKNWTVVTERVKDGASGLQTYQSYLNAKNHKNHKNTNIIPITDNSAEFFAYAAKNAMQKDAENTKGGRRVSSYAQGFNLTLPNEFQPTPAQWKMIFLKVRNDLKEHLNCDNSCFYANVHHEPKKNSHMNLLVSRCHNAKVLEKLDQRSTIAEVKKSFTKAVLDICEISPSMYKKKSTKKTSKRLSRNAYQYKMKQEELKEKSNNAFTQVLSNINEVVPVTENEFIQLKINKPTNKETQTTENIESIDKKFKIK